METFSPSAQPPEDLDSGGALAQIESIQEETEAAIMELRASSTVDPEEYRYCS